MNRRDAAKLGRVLASADGPPTAASRGAVAPGRCGLCDCGLTVENDDIVEVELAPDDPQAWLCRSCYGYVVADLGISPTRVFKAGRHRSVLLPIRPDSYELPAGSD